MPTSNQRTAFSDQLKSQPVSHQAHSGRPIKSNRLPEPLDLLMDEEVGDPDSWPTVEPYGDPLRHRVVDTFPADDENGFGSAEDDYE